MLFRSMVYECPYKCLRRGTNTICGYVPSGIYNYIFGGLLVIGLAPGWGAKHSETFFLNQDLTFISFEEGQRSYRKAFYDIYIGKYILKYAKVLGLLEKEVIFVNAVKCAFRDNAVPTLALGNCSILLRSQIKHFEPRLIITLGKAALSSIIDTNESFKTLSHKTLHYERIPVVAFPHPSYIERYMNTEFEDAAINKIGRAHV